MDTLTFAQQIKKAHQEMMDGATPEIRAAAAARYTELTASLRADWAKR